MSIVFGTERFISPDDVRSIAQRYEISAHTVTYPCLNQVPPEQLAWEILEDRRALEDWTGRPVRGMSYPNGKHSPAVRAALPMLGIEYARTTETHGRFHMPQDWLQWHPTCHHRMDIAEKWPEFLNGRNAPLFLRVGTQLRIRQQQRLAPDRAICGACRE